MISGFPKTTFDATKQCSVDLLVAVMTSGETQLRFPVSRPPPPPHQNPSIRSRQVPNSPLFGSTPLPLVLANSAFCEESIQTLQGMRDLTEIRLIGRRNSLQSCPRTSQRHPSSASLLRIIHLTATIYNRALSDPPITFSSSVNHPVMEQICHELENDANDDTWIRYP